MAPNESITVGEEFSGTRLNDFLDQHFSGVDRRFLRGLVREGRVKVNFQSADGHQKLKIGDHCSIELPEGTTEMPRYKRGEPKDVETTELAVLYEDEDLVVVHKPPGVPSLPDRAGKSVGVLGLVRQQFGSDELRSVHRLDRDTSGCLCFARTLEVARFLDRAFREKTVEKTYLALVEGIERRDEYTVTKWLGPDRRRPGKVRTVAEESKGARSAETDVRVLERFKKFTLLEVHPKTGRGHQIRVHLQSQGTPIAVDTDYGSRGPLLLSQIKSGYKSRPGQRENPLLERMFLHAQVLDLPAFGREGERIVVEAPLPEDLDTPLGKLRRFGVLREDTSRRQSTPEDFVW